MDLPKNVKDIVRLPIDATEAVIQYGIDTARHSAEVFFPSKTTAEFVDELVASDFDHQLELATKTYERGRANKDPELGFFGGGWLLHLLCRADNSPDIAAQTTQEIAKYVVEEGLDPELEPALDDNAAEHAAEVIKRFHPIKHLFPGR